MSARAASEVTEICDGARDVDVLRAALALAKSALDAVAVDKRLEEFYLPSGKSLGEVRDVVDAALASP